MRSSRSRASFPDVRSFVEFMAIIYTSELRLLRHYEIINSLQIYNVGENAMIIGDVNFIQALNFNVIHSSSTSSVLPNFQNIELTTYIVVENHSYVSIFIDYFCLYELSFFNLNISKEQTINNYIFRLSIY